MGGWKDANIKYTHEYDGTSWIVSNNLSEIKECPQGTGTQSAGLAFGGNENSGAGSLATTEEYNGTICL